ncbi:MAG: VacJ family lipoprotein [Gammaproteobacteria bacterium]|nr:VacJ family lipoprotein [Gammaproteobacteria bacterium]
MFSLRLLLLFTAVTLYGCASVNGPGTSQGGAENDPYESFNRSVYRFNDSFDNAVFKPVAIVWRDYIPRPLDDAVTNFFSNLDDISVFINDLLQLKWSQSIADLGRFSINSTLGIFGLIDVSSRLGLEKHEEDFGQSLAYWGVNSGPYLVLPFLGPSNLRDATGRGVDWGVESQIIQYDTNRTQLQSLAIYAIDTRADLLHTTTVLEESGADNYTFIREAYMQQRNYLIHDGKPPEPSFDDLFLDELP